MQGPFSYTLVVQNGEINKNRNFENPVTLNNDKIYIVSYGTRIIYVGITSQPIGTRLRAGQDSFQNPRNGYYGYHWLNENRELNLDVFVADDNEIHEDENFVETVEAEVAYLVRNIDGQWPDDQTEIHFHQSNERHRCSALNIVNIIKNRNI